MGIENEKGPAACTCEAPTELVPNNISSPQYVERFAVPDNPAGTAVFGERIDFTQFNWLRNLGIDHRVIIEVDPLKVRGRVGDDGLFALDRHGPQFLAFAQDEDFVLWQPRTGELTSLWGDPFALGEDVLVGATETWEMVLFSSPLEWLRHRGRGIVVLDWSRAFQQLSVVRHVNVPECLLPRYQAAMSRPMPKVHPYSKLQVQK